MRKENIDFNREIFDLNQNLNKNKIKKSITCWNCKELFYSNDSQGVSQCPNCNKYNSISNGIISRNKNSYFINNLTDLENNSTINNSNKIITCPFCFTKNLFRRDADELICYNCSKKIKSSNNFINYKEEEVIPLDNKIIGWRIVPSQQAFLSPPTPLPSIPMTPPAQTESNTEYLLQKILKNIKKQNSSKEFNTIQPPRYGSIPIPNFIPYPIFDYYNNRGNVRYIDDDINRNNIRFSEIKYIPIKTEKEKPKNDGYKITIRKKNRNGLSKSTVFEKVFYFK